MKTAVIIGGMAIMLIGGPALCADDLDTNLTLTYDQPPPVKYHARELSLDTFGGMTLWQPPINTITGVETRHDVWLGAGVGANYFFTRNIGIAAEGFAENPRHSFVDTADGSMVFRLPLGRSGLAAYVFGGAGHQFDTNASKEFHTGGGLEYRFTSHFGAFIEPRIVLFKAGGYGFGHCGLRWTF